MVVLRASSNEVYPEDVYEAALAGVQEETGANGLYLKWFFQVQTGLEKGLVPGFSGTSAAPGAKARKWAEALAGRPIQDGETVDLEELFGAHGRVYVSIRNGRSGQLNRVERVLPEEREVSGPLRDEGRYGRVRDRGIFVEGYWYNHPALITRGGEDVFVRSDPNGKQEIHVYTPGNWYICSAVREGKPTPLEGATPGGPDAAPLAGGG